MENKDLELIERYFSNELSAEERAVFEQKLSSDAAFRREVEAYEKAVRYVRLDGRKALQASLGARGRQLDAEKKSPASRRWWVLGALLLAVAVWWLFDGRDIVPPPAAPGSSPHPDSLEIKAPPVLPQTTSPNPEREPPPPTQDGGGAPAEQTVPNQQTEADRLFAAYFQPYKDESLEPSVRGEGDATPEETFLQTYWDGKHPEALAAFEKMEAASKNKGDLQFLQANSLLALGRVKAALAVLENLPRTRFPTEAKWLRALAFLKNGEREKAAALLREIAGEAGSARRGEAERLLSELK
jgi:hypothetical protein